MGKGHLWFTDKGMSEIEKNNDDTSNSKSKIYGTVCQEVTGGLVETELDKANKYFKSWTPLLYKECFKILSKISSSNPDEFVQNIITIKNLAYCYQNGKGTKRILIKLLYGIK